MFEGRNNTEALLKLKKVLAFLTSLTLIVISIWFSQMGFGIESTKEYVWIGWVLGITVTVIELTFNTNVQKLNATLVAAGVIAYIYGMYTNVIGLKEILGDNLMFAIVVGLFVEVLPEPLFAWSISVYDGGDVLGNIGSLFGTGQPQKQQNWKPSNNQHQMPMGFRPAQQQQQPKHKGKDRRQELERTFHKVSKPKTLPFHGFNPMNDDDELE